MSSDRRSRALEARQALLRMIVVVLVAMMIPWGLALAQDEEANPDEETPATDEATASGQQEQICNQMHDAPEGQPFNPTVIDIYLDGQVGSSMGAQLFHELELFLNTYQSLKTINILLSSSGGDVEWGIKIHNYLRGLHELHGLQIVTHNTYSVESAAIDIYCAGNQRITSPHTYFMLHDANMKVYEGDYDLKALSDHEESVRIDSKAAHALVSSCTNLPVTAVEKMFAEQTYIDVDRALEIGMAHSIIPATFNRDAAYICRIEGAWED